MQTQKLQILILPGCICIYIFIFCNLFICFVFNSLLKLICFRMIGSKHLITFENTCLVSYRFHCVNIFYIKSSLCEAFTVTNSMTRHLLIKTLYKFRTVTCSFATDLPYPTYVCFRLVKVQIFCISHLVFCFSYSIDICTCNN